MPICLGLSDGLYVDGMLMCKLINLLWRRSIPRLSFDMSGMAVDLFRLLDEAAGDKTVYFIGAKQEEPGEVGGADQEELSEDGCCRVSQWLFLGCR